MKTPEDEAFDDLAKRQGHWGGGFMAKKAMAADKLQEDRIKYGTSWEQDGKRIDPMSVYKEQPAQEPVAECVDDGEGGVYYRTIKKHIGLLYTAPSQREWVGLTDDEVAQAMYRTDAIFTGPMQFNFARAIEQALKEKNA